MANRILYAVTKDSRVNQLMPGPGEIVVGGPTGPVKIADRLVDVRTKGAVLGASVDLTTAQANLAALHAARDAAKAGSTGPYGIYIPGTLAVAGSTTKSHGAVVCDFEDLGDTPLSIVGEGGLFNAARILYVGTDTPDYLLSLKGTRRTQIRHLMLDGNAKTKYGLYCARTAYPNTAGKHFFEQLTAYNCTIASHLNYGSEENTYLHCQFQRSPIGAIFTAYQVVADPSVVGATPVDYAGTYNDTTANFAYDCAFGSAVGSNPTPRCGLMLQRAQLFMAGGVVQTSPNAEAGAIIDGNYMASEFHGVNWDSAMPNIGVKVGAYSQAQDVVNFRNVLLISGGDMTITTPASGATAFIDAWNLKWSHIGPLRMSAGGINGPGINLNDSRCAGNTFERCFRTDGTDVPITATSAAASNIAWGVDGRLRWLGTGGNPDAALSYVTPGALHLDGTYEVKVPTGQQALKVWKDADTSAALQISRGGTLQWGSGTAAADVTLARLTAAVIGTAAGQGFRAGTTTTTGRPTPASMGAGTQLFDTDLKKPIWSDGTAWRDASGTAV